MFEPYISDPDFALYVGDVREVLAEFPDESVHCVVTSPPYWGLRDYSVEGQLGLEATPDLYIESMVAVFREVRRVLRRDGTCWLNLGDSYASGEIGRHDRSDGYDGEFSRSSTQGERKQARLRSGLKPKDLVGIPWRVAFALQADGWYLRSDIIWSKPNPMPESVTDRPTKAHEYLFLLTRSARYFYDAEAIREADSGLNGGGFSRAYAEQQPNHGAMRLERPTVSGRNRRSVWEIATEPYPDAHFATFPQALVEPCVKAGTSEWGCCPVCGAPWYRQTDATYDAQGRTTNGPRSTERRNESPGRDVRMVKTVETTGWLASCTHGEPPVPCTVLDPFMGSGTTALVARRLGRKSIGIELNEEYAALAARRLQQLSLLADA